MSDSASESFSKLLDVERKDLGWSPSSASAPPEVKTGPSGEPHVTRLREDIVGLALSGGGIRSATFALGLLQGLHHLGLLQSVHYLSTVSGGGYVGSWWTVWRFRRRQAAPAAERERFVFPDLGDPPKAGEFEHSAVRHLREFSNFLIPRLGFFELETWSAVLGALCSMLPSLLIAGSLIACIESLWLALAGLGRTPEWGFVITLVSTAAVFAGFECWQRKNWKKHGIPPGSLGYILLAALASFGAASVRWLLAAKCGGAPPAAESSVGDLLVWLRSFFVAAPAKPQWHFDAYLYWGLWACLSMAAAGILARLVLLALPGGWGEKFRRSLDLPLERVLMRLLAVAAVELVLALVWEVGFNLRGSNVKLLWASLTAGGSAGAFALLRNWWQQVDTASRSQGWAGIVRPYVGTVLAYLAVGLMAAVTAAVLPAPAKAQDAVVSWVRSATADPPTGLEWAVAVVSKAVDYGAVFPVRPEHGFEAAWWVMIAAGAAVVVRLSLCLPPEQFGLHELYRRRLARAYLGASHADQVAEDFHGHEENRQTDLRKGDDLPLAGLKVSDHGAQSGAGRPLHLICCAANNVSGDPVVNLGRGARSAVLSPHGISIGGAWGERPELLLSSAMTASAAAFNSQMGQKSIKLGPAVAFLMTALNLRLGLWQPHPADPSSRPSRPPGLRRLKEMFSWTFAGGESGDVHLSDGGHFENLGLYELVRRHCRYIIVSDGSQDPDVQFEDFGNAVRRIRTDFGVDIDIDLTPLKPGSDQLSRQHMAVGTIRYEASRNDDDVGIVLYFKPSLTGDEPCDVENYKRLNPQFPHESTGDQFYDEAQWESYRRLGVHAAETALAFLDRVADKKTRQGQAAPLVPAWVQRAFTQARDTWFAAVAGFDETAQDLRRELGQLEFALAEPVHERLAAEIYPDFVRDGAAVRPPAPPSPDALRKMLPLLVRMVQLIERVYAACGLDQNFNHPHVLIWMNTFHRWCQSPTFRRVWPILSPLVAPAARRFAEDRFGLPTMDNEQLSFELEFPATFADLSEAARAALPAKPAGAPKYVSLKLEVSGLPAPCTLEVGVWRLWRQDGGSTLTWEDNEFVIYKGYWGAGLGGRFLNECLKPESLLRREAAGTTLLRVQLRRDPRAPHGTRDLGHRRERNDLVLFYKALGFQTVLETPREVVLELPLA